VIGSLAGVAILFVAYSAWGIAIYGGSVTPLFDRLFLFVPAVAGFVSSWMAPRSRLAPSVFLAVPAALFAAVVNAALQMAGRDLGFYGGAIGPLRVAFFTLLSAGLFCAVGGLLAVIARRVTGRA
jgi:hypothetical protein